MEQGNQAGRDAAARTRRIALHIQYDGTAYNGWQIQNGGRTIQGELERAIGILTRHEARVTASGRTDTGVHAFCQVAHFDDESDLSLGRLCGGLNGILPRDISIKNVYAVPPDFHARFGALAREYLYLIYNHSQRNPFMRHRAMWCHEKLDPGYLRSAASFLVGEHDYKSFCKKISSDGNTVRRIDEIDINCADDIVAIRIKGNGFLHNMIRSIVGTLCEMNRGKRAPDHMHSILMAMDRNAAGTTAPACGLYLNRVWYDPPLSSMPDSLINY
jgi:tRNA pseudouridine38-40 synthase